MTSLPASPGRPLARVSSLLPRVAAPEHSVRGKAGWRKLSRFPSYKARQQTGALIPAERPHFPKLFRQLIVFWQDQFSGSWLTLFLKKVTCSVEFVHPLLGPPVHQVLIKPGSSGAALIVYYKDGVQPTHAGLV